MILDTRAEVFVWVGQSVDPKEKQKAFEIGQKYIDLAACLDGLSPYVPLYRVTEGSEPCFFTTYFSWDPAKAVVLGNSFQKKALLLFGAGHAAEMQGRSHGNQGGPTQRASALAALNSAFKPSPATKTTAQPRTPGRGSQRAAAIAALSTVLTAEKKGSHDSSPTRHKRNPPSETGSPGTPTPRKHEEPSHVFENSKVSEVTTKTYEQTLDTKEEDSSTKVRTDGNENHCMDVHSTFSYEQLRAKSNNPITGIDFKRREAYLSPQEFEVIFGMKKEAFYELPTWKQNQKKKTVDLF